MNGIVFATFLCFCVVFKRSSSSSEEYFISKYEINGEDFVESFVDPRKVLVVRNASKKMPLYNYFDEPSDSDRHLNEVQVNRYSAATGESYSTEQVSLGYFINDEHYGATFKYNISKEEKSIYDFISFPAMITSCATLKQNFDDTATLLMQGTKTRQATGFGANCLKKNTLIAVLLGNASYRISKKDTMKLSKGDMIFMPKGMCYRSTSIGTFVDIKMQWEHKNGLVCEAKSLYSVSKDLPINVEDMEYVSSDNIISERILNTGFSIPPIGLGTSRLFHHTYDTVLKALELDYRLIDTAQAYSGERRLSDFSVSSEMEIGRALKDSGVFRSELFLVTKLNPEIATKEDTLSSIEKSLKDLQTDYIDLMLIHDFYADECDVTTFGLTPECKGSVWETWRILEKYQNEGVLKSIGVSNINVLDLKVLLKFAKNKISAVQNWFDPFHQDTEVRELCKENGIIYMGYSTLGYSWIDDVHGLGYRSNPVFHHPDIITGATQRDLPISSFILRWAMENDVITIPCTTNHRHLEMNILSRSQYVGNAILALNDLDNLLGNPDTDEDWERSDFPWKVRDEL